MNANDKVIVKTEAGSKRGVVVGVSGGWVAVRLEGEKRVDEWHAVKVSRPAYGEWEAFDE